jgi:orotate phosphoribosyltransferase-like protein
MLSLKTMNLLFLLVMLEKGGMLSGEGLKEFKLSTKACEWMVRAAQKGSGQHAQIDILLFIREGKVTALLYI